MIGESLLGTEGGHHAEWLRTHHPEAVALYRPEAALDGPAPGLEEAGTSAVPDDLHYNTWIADRALDFLARAEASGSHLDLMPTLLELAGVDAPPDLDGRSLVPVLRGAPPAPRDRFLEFHPRIDGRFYNHSIVTDGWRMTLYPDGEPDWGELFDLEADPGEHENLFDDPRAPHGPGPLGRSPRVALSGHAECRDRAAREVVIATISRKSRRLPGSPESVPFPPPRGPTPEPDRRRRPRAMAARVSRCSSVDSCGTSSAKTRSTGTVVGSVEVHPPAEPQEGRERTAETRHAGVRQGAAFTEAGGAESLARDEKVEDALGRERRVGAGEDLSQDLEGALPARRRHVAAHAVGREDLIEGHHCGSLSGCGRSVRRMAPAVREPAAPGGAGRTSPQSPPVERGGA